MSFIIPRPVRDIVVGPFEINHRVNQIRNTGPDSAASAIVGIFGGGFITLPPASKMMAASARLSFAALGAFALYKAGSSIAIAAVLGATVSLPSVAIVGGSWLLYHAATALTASLASGSFMTLGIGMASLAGGWLTLECHDIIPFGIAERLIVNTLVNAYSQSVAGWFI